MISFMGENKRLLNIHEHKFVELAAFKAKKTVFQANTNASEKYGDTNKAIGPSNSEKIKGCLPK